MNFRKAKFTKNWILKFTFWHRRSFLWYMHPDTKWIYDTDPRKWCLEFPNHAKPLKVQLLMYNNERFLSSKTKSSKIAKSYHTTWHFFQSFPPTFEWLLFVSDLWDLRRKIRHHSQNFRGYKWKINLSIKIAKID